ncbi:MAG: cytochrome c maturation protein CcmE [Rhodospirillaceae bacterium]|nr:cytochrome c maturation protein CcmE [Rhodospirillaceae bacterium]
MKRKTLRLYLVLISLGLLGTATALVLNAFDRELVFFFSPSEIAAEQPAPGRVIRLGGLVETGSVTKLGDGATFSFRITDLKASTSIAYRGVLPDLFREGQGVVVQGTFNESGNFVASEVLAKHDENYLPPEVAKALKASGRWQEGAGTEASPVADPGTSGEGNSP